ncbi:MAG: methyltransferase domain-containing protein [Verrucomicrobiota bacterium]|nr:methyltransferase domain-containing protein [Verrucomicrobiota bacterium]
MYTLNNFFRCPNCQNKLANKNDKVICPECKKSYSSSCEIPDFRTLFKEGEWDSQIFEKIYLEVDAEYEDADIHAKRCRIPEFIEKYRRTEKDSPIYEFIKKQKPQKLLDLGCGYGWYTFTLAKYLPNTIFFGADISEKRIKAYSKKIKQKKIGTFIPVLANAEKLPFPNNLFDIIVMREVLEHVADPEKTLKEINKKLAPRGTLIITTPTKKMRIFWYVATFFPRIIKNIFAKTEKKESIYDVPLSKRKLKKLFNNASLNISSWHYCVLLPHESLLQFFPEWVLKIFILFSPIMHFLKINKIFALHHLIFLDKKKN